MSDGIMLFYFSQDDSLIVFLHHLGLALKI